MKEVIAVDMFPHTEHYELVMLLERRNSCDSAPAPKWRCDCWLCQYYEYIGASNKVDIARYWLQSTTICCDFSFDGYLHL